MSCAKGLKRVLSNSAEVAGEPFGRFRREYELNDFLENVLSDTDDPITAGVKALHHFCTDAEDRFNGCSFAIKGILNYVNGLTSECPSTAEAEEKCHMELKSLLLGGCTVESLKAWAGRWYRL